MDLDLVCVESFLVLVQEGHHRRAAARLSITSSALTKRVQRLVRQVGVPLLVRGAAAAPGPTPAGARFAREAGPLLEQARAARRAARSPGRTVLRLGVPGAVGEYPRRRDLVALGARLRRTHPDVTLQCQGLPFTDLVRGLVSESVDVVWMAGAVTHPGVVSTPCAVLHRSGVVGPRSPFADAVTVPVEDFADAELLHNPRAPDSYMRLWYLGDLRARSDARLVEVAADDHRSLLTALVRSRAVTVMPRPFARLLPPPLRTVAIEGLPPVVFTVCHRRADRRPVLHELLQVVAERAEELAGV
ncbi:LysR family transcriptional regulator [Kineococcus rubinsiae]|uniref:LysR family transcriptional regulator n=1 Tax=Kineococcus rubinsiae TaxID=2609562 RepID=UPI0014307CFE|nr:LysR family transcriptional regulator [Kineococcus rubinsiae]